MIVRVAAAILAGSLVVGAAAAQSDKPSSEKQETSCTTASPGATTGRAGEKTSNTVAMEKSAILPDAGGSNSAAPTVQSGGKPLEVRPDCPPEPKSK